MPVGTINSTTRASAAIGTPAESNWLTGTFNPALLISGNNVIAVEIHQADPDSSDISFNFELTGSVAAPAQAQARAQTATAAAAPPRVTFFSLQKIEDDEDEELLV